MPSQPSQTLFVSALQFDVKLGRMEENVSKALSLLEKVGPGRPHLALLPEGFTTNFTFHKAKEIVAHSKEALGRFAKAAREMNLAVAGSLVEGADAPGVYENSGFFIDEKGERLLRYPKRHLIRLGHEHLFYRPGPADAQPLVRWQGALVGMAICYDIRFPEWIGRLAFEGASLLLVPAQWPSERAGHWRALLKARAIENQFYVAACNRTGSMEGTPFPGASEILDPWGESLAFAAEIPETLITAEISLPRIDDVRQKLPAFIERRAEERKA
ncbi:MAG: nitrilase-related carbon-nitrogen hydrolase [Bdellovibrionota bacterium]